MNYSEVILNKNKKLVQPISKEESSIEKWKKKGGGRKPPIVFSAEGEQILMDVGGGNEKIKNKNDLIDSTLFEVSGSLEKHFALTLIQQNGLCQIPEAGNQKIVNSSNSFINTMMAMKPQDEIEGMLLTQIFSLQTLAMDCAARVASSESVDRNVNNLTKLFRLQHEAIEKLTRYRRKGTQQVVVQHVNVENGGKAIVGGVFEEGGGKAKI